MNEACCHGPIEEPTGQCLSRHPIFGVRVNDVQLSKVRSEDGSTAKKKMATLGHGRILRTTPDFRPLSTYCSASIGLWPARHGQRTPFRPSPLTHERVSQILVSATGSDGSGTLGF